MGERTGPEARLRELPAVHEVAAGLEGPHALAVQAARLAIDEHRQARLNDRAAPVAVPARARELLAELQRPSLRPVINATGVILHTNLGRAPLAPSAREAVDAAAGYSNLELELESGRRGSRHQHVESLLCRLTGAESAIAVNNGAAAVLLAVAAIAGPGRGVLVSRGQLVEIGGGFRIPEVIAQCGARLIEVGTTNRTRLRDYENALAALAPEQAGAVLRVHQSNFRTVGFVHEVEIEELCRLGPPVIDDLGSGMLADPATIPVLAGEPAPARSLAAGAALVCCSADKLLGGPQAGLILGRSAAVAACRAHPLARAARIDKLSLAGLEATLRLYLDPQQARREVPVLRMLAADEATLEQRAQRLRRAIGDAAEIVRASARVGGGALPLAELQGPVVALVSDLGADDVASALRRADPPVLARVHEGRVLLDPRTLADDELELVAAAARAAIA